ncbi:1-deoxy-D-xylulose-5-phosphate synthase [Proteiniclasticum sp. BAD-10]|uniref:1-deoxy-D-xylulose-5-phosphate synthase n=1 Tax=Proteiniclasticum sediminis TaxID=2804028 RepID=A0A941CMT4_9CLOT|nr:1-deoxy-D-xylulose-5-phosphate synthase [Proteiniclasticum sediminis]
MGILKDGFKAPEDIKALSLEELYMLSEEIRSFLVESVSKTGGHLAPNLGVVELTVSLFNVFDLEKDKIIYDVGHQSYVHKILTGRKDAFGTLRQFEGLSGFPKREESRYDIFDTGHSSTSISAALGIARARDLKEEDFQVIAVIGDGALTGGMAMEALNDVGDKKTDLIIVLNDNQMSISRNVGGISTYLSQFRGDPGYERAKKEVQELLDRMPLGKSINKSVDKVKDGIKSMLLPGMLFENMGLTYLGPVDGHNIKEMSKVLKVARDMKGPKLVHVITKKGKGYVRSEQHPEMFHGVPPFNTDNGKAKAQGKTTYSKVFGTTLMEMAKNNRDIVAVVAAMPDGTGLTGFKELYPKRLFDVGIAEQHAVTLAAGLAVGGMKPYVALYSTFLQRAFDQVVHDLCIQKLPVTLCIDRAGLVGDDGETHQGILDLSFLTPIPNLTVMAPKSLDELKYMLYYSETFPGPLAIRYPRGGDPEDFDLPPLKTFTPGKFEVLAEGKDGYLYATGKMVQKGLKIIQRLQAEGLSFGLVNGCFIKPVDEALILQHLEAGKCIVTLEDNLLHGGFGSMVLEAAAGHKKAGRILPLGFRDTFVVQGSVEKLYEKYGLGLETITARIRKFAGEKNE